MNQPGGEVTRLLREWRGGDSNALEQLMPMVYAQLRSLAYNYMRSERPGHTLQPTAVVHEAYLRLAESNSPFADRAHFFAVAATVMRHVLLDWARSNQRVKRGGGLLKDELQEHSAICWEDPDTIVEVDRLLTRMLEFDQRKTKVVEMIFFAGMTYEETAEVLGISAVTVHRELKMAKAWMRTELLPKSLSAAL